ncbi:MAG: DUF86 domain-containing protein [Candidatus Atribacteria bacterium]|nr:DUF86 domain-containing protein [Candidatus Atribacteria bacterium]
MPVDKERITFLLGEIEKALSILKEFQKEEKAKIIGDPKILGSVKYYFIVVMEGCIDVGNHILSREHRGVPESYADVFTALGQNGVLPDSLAQNLAHMAKFRNLLVHLYSYIKFSNTVFKMLTNLSIILPKDIFKGCTAHNSGYYLV